MNYWMKIDRFFAWLLFFVMILYFLSGYGMTKNLIDASFAIQLHNTWLPVLVIVSFVVHGSYATRLAFIRWEVWSIFVKIIWGLLFACILIGFLYVEFFYQKPIANIQNVKTTSSQTASTNKATTSSGSITSTPSTSQTQQIFTKETLSAYNGKNGNPSYIAIDGVVYDVSSLFINGVHQGCTAGQDVTDGFSIERKHTVSMLTNYPVVGTYEK